MRPKTGNDLLYHKPFYDLVTETPELVHRICAILRPARYDYDAECEKCPRWQKRPGFTAGHPICYAHAAYFTAAIAEEFVVHHADTLRKMLGVNTP